MDAQVPEREGSNIVLLGAFNPRIFQPSWFVRYGLLPESASADSDVTLINNDYCRFSTDWCNIEVLPDRFTVDSMTAPAPEQIRDLVLGTFETLKHTPIQRVGLNVSAHFALRDERAWHEFGHRLVPKDDLWGPVLKNPGTLNVTVHSEREEPYLGSLQVVVEPSNLVQNGIFISTNDDYGVLPKPDSAEWAVQVVREEWTESRRRALSIREHLLARALAGSHD